MKHHRIIKTLTTLSFLLIGLSGCKTVDGIVEDVDTFALDSALLSSESDPDNLTFDANCPRVEIVPELKYYTEFQGEGFTRDDALVTRATITNVQTACTYARRSVTVDMKAHFDGIIGARGRTNLNDKPYFSYPFFVAVAESSGKILTKEIYSAGLSFPPGRDKQSYKENMRFILPLETRDHGNNQKILLGFQLTPEQLSYNRELLKEDRLRLKAERQKRREEMAKAEKSETPEDNPHAPQNLLIDPNPQAPAPRHEKSSGFFDWW